MNTIIERIVDGGLCHGCGACAAALGDKKVSMTKVSPGYARPRANVELSTDEEKLVEAVCSGKSIVQRNRGVEYDTVWGPLLSVETGYSTDPEIRFKGSSGGTTTAILAYLLSTQEVDFVLNTRADPDDPLSNITVPSYNRDDLLTSAGSRYAPSMPLANIEEHLQSGKNFAFVGKPCDVAALRMMAEVDPRIDRQIPYKLSFFCAGVPSRQGAVSLINKMGVTEETLASFAYRGRGWPGLARAVRKDGSESVMDYHSSWGAVLSRNLQFRCKICPEGVGEFADIACADAWYGKDGYPDFTERDGRSLVIARTPAGRKLLDRMTSANALVLEPLDPKEIKLMQPYQFDRRRAVLVRLAAMAARGRRLPHFAGMGLLKQTLKSSPIWLAKNFLGTFRRIPFGKPLK